MADLIHGLHSSTKAASCVDYVANNPGAFKDVYWSIKSLKVFQPLITTNSSSSSTVPSITPVASTSSVSSAPVGMGRTSTTANISTPYSATATGSLGFLGYNRSTNTSMLATMTRAGPIKGATPAPLGDTTVAPSQSAGRTQECKRILETRDYTRADELIVVGQPRPPSSVADGRIDSSIGALL